MDPIHVGEVGEVEGLERAVEQRGSALARAEFRPGNSNQICFSLASESQSSPDVCLGEPGTERRSSSTTLR